MNPVTNAEVFMINKQVQRMQMVYIDILNIVESWIYDVLQGMSLRLSDKFSCICRNVSTHPAFIEALWDSAVKERNQIKSRKGYLKLGFYRTYLCITPL